MKTKIFGIAMSSLLAFPLACGSQAPSSEDVADPALSPSSAEAVGQTSGAIQGGSETTDYNYAVGVYNTQIGGVCSGTLIAPNLVLTARHCVDELASEAVDCATSKFTGNAAPSELVILTCPKLAQSCRQTHRVAKAFRPPSNSICGNDITLLMLSDDVPASEAVPVTPAVQKRVDDASFGNTYTAIGYGITSPSDRTGATAGTRRIRQDISIECVSGHRLRTRDCARYGSSAETGITANDFVAGEGTCQGDSGSGAFEQKSFEAGNPVTLGILSRGGAAPGSTSCGMAIYTRTDAWASLIIGAAKEAAAAGNYPVPAWAAGDGVTVGGDAGTTAPTLPDGGAVDPGEGPGGVDPKTDLGETCESNEVCASGVCAAPPGSTTFVCSQSCDASNACPTGFTCADGYCFEGDALSPNNAQVDGGASGANASGSDETGCSVSATRSLGAGSSPWRSMGGVAFGLAALAAGRRRRAAR